MIEGGQKVGTAQARSGQDRLCIAVLAVVAGAIFFVGLNAFGIIDPGDGYFSEAAREMVERGDYVVPHLNYQVYFSKPIMIYWLIASSYNLLGISEFAARVPGALIMLALVLSTYWTVRSLSGWRAGLLAGLILSTSPLVVTFARLSMVDAPFAGFVGIAVNSLVMTLFAGSPRWWPVFWAALALSMLTKGPVGVVLIGLASLLFVILRRPGRAVFSNWLKRLHLIVGPLIFVAIVLPWHLAVAEATHGLFLKVFYVYENFGRFKGQTNHEHREPWFYLVTLSYGFAPWVLFLPPAIYRALKRRCRWDQESAAALYFASFAICLFGLFTLSVAKLQTYMLPAFSSLAALTALWLCGQVEGGSAGRKASRWLLIPSAALAVVGAVALLGGPIAMFVIKHVPVWAKVCGCLAGLTVGCGYVWQFLFLRRGLRGIFLPLLTATTALGFILVTPVAFDLGYRLRQAALHEVLEPLKGRRYHVAFFQEFKPGVMFYLKQPVDSFFSPDQLLPADSIGGRPDKGGAPVQIVIASRKSLPLLKAVHGDRFRGLAENRKWGAYEAVGLRVQKLPTLEETFSKNIKLDVGGYTWGTLPFAGGTPPWEREPEHQ